MPKSFTSRISYWIPIASFKSFIDLKEGGRRERQIKEDKWESEKKERKK